MRIEPGANPCYNKHSHNKKKGGSTMNITIRRCMITDTDTIFALCREELGYDFPKSQVEANIRRMMGEANNLLLVAESRGEVVGPIPAHNHERVFAPPSPNTASTAWATCWWRPWRTGPGKPAPRACA